jgi:hypothetical protein
MARERRKPWTKQEAEAELERWRSSGMSMAEHCRQRGIEPKRLYKWQRRLSEAKVKQRGGQQNCDAPVEWLEATVSGLGASVPVVSVQLRSGDRIEVGAPERVEPSWLSALVHGLRGEQ